MGGSYLACSLFSQRSSVHYISFIKSNGSYNKVNPSSGHLAAVSKGWDLGRYQGTSGVTAPSALTGQDPHLKYLPLVGLCVFCLFFFFLSKWSASAFLSLVGIAYVPITLQSAISVAHINGLQTAQKFTPGKRQSIFCLQICWRCKQAHHLTQRKKRQHFLNQPTNESMLHL